MSTVRIPVRNAGEYEVVIGRDLGAEIDAAVPAGAKKALLVHQPAQTRRAEAIRERLAGRVEVLLLRPTGMDTLATRLWSATGIGRYAEAAPYALLLVALAAVPTWVVVRRTGIVPASSAAAPRAGEGAARPAGPAPVQPAVSP